MLTSLSLIAFAGNSVLCRIALQSDSIKGQAIDAGSFSLIRLLSGCVMLLIILGLTKNKCDQQKAHQTTGSWFAGLALFIYAVFFSFAYVTLDTGTGALILFASVQITLITAHFLSGNRLSIGEWVGVLIAFSGFGYLMLPGANTPNAMGFLLMCISGIAWGFYTLAGRSSANPLNDTGYNFFRTLPLLFVLALLLLLELSTVFDIHLSTRGILLAIASGAIASGIGYALWYMALAQLSALNAAVLQLLVPVIANIGGVIFAGESLSRRLIVASLLILGGILIVILSRNTVKTR